VRGLSSYSELRRRSGSRACRNAVLVPQNPLEQIVVHIFNEFGCCQDIGTGTAQSRASQISEIPRNSPKIRTYASSRSSRVIHLGANRNRICNSVLVINCQWRQSWWGPGVRTPPTFSPARVHILVDPGSIFTKLSVS